MQPIDVLLDGYLAAADAAGIPYASAARTETLAAPHEPPKLPVGFGAVYVFSLRVDYSAGAVEPGRVLKVGKAGPASNPRFQYQHYSATSAGSTLARSLVETPVLWPFLGVESVTADSVKQWLLRNTDRSHVYLSSGDYKIHGSLLEKYIRGLVGPVFEG